MTTTATTIEPEDTVAVAGRKGYGIVDEIRHDGRIVVTFVWTTRDYATRTMTTSYRPDQVTLVRKGNRDADIIRYYNIHRDLDTAVRLADRDHRTALRAYRNRTRTAAKAH